MHSPIWSAWTCSGARYFLDDAFLDRFIDQTKGAWKYGFGIRRLPVFNRSAEFPHLRLEFMTIGLIQYFELQALTVPL